VDAQADNRSSESRRQRFMAGKVLESKAPTIRQGPRVLKHPPVRFTLRIPVKDAAL